MFRILTIIVFALILLGITLHYKVRRARPDQDENDVSNAQGFWSMIVNMRISNASIRTVYRIMLVSFLMLVLTGFGPLVLLGRQPTGYLMILHIVAAPFFAVCLAALVLTLAYRSRFDSSDWQGLLRFLRGNGFSGKSGLIEKMAFWLMAFSSLPVILSITFSMFRIFDTKGQEFLLGLHGYSALVLVVATLVYGYLRMVSHRR